MFILDALMEIFILGGLAGIYDFLGSRVLSLSQVTRQMLLTPSTHKNTRNTNTKEYRNTINTIDTNKNTIRSQMVVSAAVAVTSHLANVARTKHP